MGEHQVCPPHCPGGTPKAPAPRPLCTRRQEGRAGTKHRPHPCSGQELGPTDPNVRGEEQAQGWSATVQGHTANEHRVGVQCWVSLTPAPSIHLWRGFQLHLRIISAADITCLLCPRPCAIPYTGHIISKGGSTPPFLQIMKLRCGEGEAFVQGHRVTRGSCFKPRPPCLQTPWTLSAACSHDLLTSATQPSHTSISFLTLRHIRPWGKQPPGGIGEEAEQDTRTCRA